LRGTPAADQQVYLSLEWLAVGEGIAGVSGQGVPHSRSWAFLSGWEGAWVFLSGWEGALWGSEKVVAPVLDFHDTI